jgi:hypothetical protein
MTHNGDEWMPIPVQKHQPLPKETRDEIISYCDRDLANDSVYEKMFDFLSDKALRDRVIREVKSARYIYKLMSALGVQGAKLEAHLKFQITQYASVYESIISHLLWTTFQDTDELKNLETHKAYKKACAWPSKFEGTFDGEPVFLCALRDEKTPTFSIKFDDKVDAAVKIGFVERSIGEEIKTLYKLRNAIHIESAVKNNTAFEIEQARIAYLRLQPFTIKIRKFLNSKPLPAKDLEKLAAEAAALA